MKPAWVKWADRPDEAKEAAEYLAGTADNLLDGGVLNYPATRTLRAFSADRSLVYMPVQQVPMLESLGINKGARELEIAGALKALVQNVVWQARQAGMGEVYFLCREETTCKFAEANGFERVCGNENGVSLFRMKVPN